MEEIVTSGEEVKPIVLTREERLEAENLALHVRLAALSKEKLITDANARLEVLNQQLQTYQKQIKELQKALSDKYGIDFAKQQIEPDTGRIIGTPNSM